MNYQGPPPRPMGPPMGGPSGSNTGLIIAIVVVLLIIIVGVVYYMYFMPTDQTDSGQTDSDGQVTAPVYKFYPGKDSWNGDLKHMPSLANKPNQLKQTCNTLDGCKGFNTNGWLKNRIKPQNEWKTWTSNPNKGLYVKQPESFVAWY